MQESKYITINTKSLFEGFESRKENLEITDQGLHLQRRVLMLEIKSLCDPNMDFLSTHTFYIKKKTKSILTSHKAYGENQFSKYTSNLTKANLTKVVENPEGVIVDKETFYVTGTFKAPQRKRKEDFVTLEKRDLNNISKYIDKKLVLLLVENSNFDDTSAYKGIYYSEAVDSGVQQTQWYRFMLEGEFPEGTRVEFHYYISDYPRDKKVSIPVNEWEEGLPGSSDIQGEKRRDALFRTEKKGRYLWFRITLVGTEEVSPAISSVTIFFPKVSYLEYLPSGYSENFENRDFLDRFLAIFESIFFEIDFTIAHLSKWLDAAGTPPEFLEWLGNWIGADLVRLENTYEKKGDQEAKHREYISKAVSMYRKRGTKEGLKNLICFYTGKNPIIIDNIPFCSRENIENENKKKDQNMIKEGKFPYGKETGKIKISSDNILFERNNFSFLVLFKEEIDEAEEELVRNVIESEKPAYTTYDLRVIGPWFYLDGNAYLGVNTQLRNPRFLLGKHSVLGRDTTLVAEYRSDIAEDGV